MRVTDLKPLMVFRPVNDGIPGGEFVLDVVRASEVAGRFLFHGREDMLTVQTDELLDPAKWAFDPVVTAGTMEAKIQHLASRLSGLEAVLTPRPGDESKDAVSELSAVLWFLASLTCDHEPGCAIKQADGSPCDCDVMLKEGDEWRARVRGALRLVGKLRVEQVKSSILSCNGCGDPLKSGEMMVCKQCSELLELKQTVRDLKEARRVVQARPVAGREMEFGPWRGVDYALPGSERSVLVVRLPSENVAPYAHEQLAHELRKRLPKTTEVLLTRDGVELTILELP